MENASESTDEASSMGDRVEPSGDNQYSMYHI
jgi:hypothetical protein